MFIERAVGIENARAIYEKEAGEPISQRELVRRLAADGYPVSQSHISRMQETVRCLLPVIPSALYSGLGKPQIERLLSLRNAASQTWITHTEGKDKIPEFEGLFQDVLSLFDGDASEFVYERVQDELISHMQSGTGLAYEQLLLTLSENQNQARRSSVIDTPVSLTPAQQPRPEGLPPEDDDPGSDQQQEPGIQAHTPEPSKNKGKEDVSPKSSKNEADKPPPQAPELTEEKRAARLAGHIVSPISTTERVQDVKRQLAALDGENLPDFKTNALISIPVQAGGLHPISDVWYIERILDQPDELRPVIAQLAREIAHLSGINPDSVIDVPGGLGFLCQDPPEDLDLSDLANNVLTLLQSISGVYAIALIKESPEQPLDVSEFQFTAALAQLLLGSPRYEDREAILQGRLDDTCVVKLFRLIRLGRRLVELEVESVSVVQTP
ncbi:hypothetical protein ALP24_03623 [Pseudomonas syringae pv. aptata]|uniref:Uncharacterized protein n=1 Tax=Pseudomonas syringae pv. aptata TaxID=83167 RepID=A0A3M5X140_PSEAP|nr:hypothetical protein ALP24_03623 [Pseudomonas syringae pv. aptata]